MLQDWTRRQVELIYRRCRQRHDRERADAIEHVARGASQVLGDKGKTAKLIRKLRGEKE